MRVTLVRGNVHTNIVERIRTVRSCSNIRLDLKLAKDIVENLPQVINIEDKYLNVVKQHFDITIEGSRPAIGDIVEFYPRHTRNGLRGGVKLVDRVDEMSVFYDGRIEVLGALLMEVSTLESLVKEEDLVRIVERSGKPPAPEAKDLEFKHKPGDTITYQWDDKQITDKIKDVYAVISVRPTVNFYYVMTYEKHIVMDEDIIQKGTT